MGKQMTFHDLVNLRAIAGEDIRQMSARARLPGMSRDMTVQEQAALAYYKASVSILVQKGAIRDGFVDPEDPFVHLEVPVNPDSVDDHGFCLHEPEKKRGLVKP